MQTAIKRGKKTKRLYKVEYNFEIRGYKLWRRVCPLLLNGVLRKNIGRLAQMLK